MSNDLVAELAKECAGLAPLGSGRQFLGVFPWNELPTGDIVRAARGTEQGEEEEGRKVSFIVNIGGHFVSVVVGRRSVIYIDSFAAPLLRAEVGALFSRLQRDAKYARTVYVNQRQIQSLSSTFCGMYAVLFSLWYLVDPSRRPKQVFHDKSLARNDKLCLAYLKEMIRAE